MVVCLSPNGAAISSSDEPANEILVGTIRGIVHFERESPDLPWKESRRSIEDVHVSSVLYEEESGTIFVGGHGQGGLWASTDRGMTWERRQTGIEENHIFHLAAQKVEGGIRMLAGVEPAALYCSMDLGQSWTRLPALNKVPGTEKWTFPPPPHLAHAKNVAWHPSDPDTFYVCVEQGALLKTTDAGEHFTELASYESPDDLWYHDTHRIVIKESDPNTLFLASGEGIYRSEDAGETWKHIQTRDDRLGYPDAMAIDPHNENTIFIAGAGDPPRTWVDQQLGTSNAGVIRSDDNGETFREVTAGLPDPVIGNIEAMSLSSHLGGVELFCGTATGEMYYSGDRGDSWEVVAVDIPPVSKVHHYRWFLPKEERDRIEELARAGF